MINYYAETLEAITGAKIPAALREQIPQITNAAEFKSMGDFVNDLQDWASANANPSFATGESMLDAALLIIERSFENANLRRDADGEVYVFA